ncbi:MAG: hypothetical protein ACSHX9_10810 [Luteolibacter sp.]
MSRKPFILGTTLLCVAATIAFLRIVSSSDTREDDLLASAVKLRPAQARGDSADSASASRPIRPEVNGAGVEVSLEKAEMAKVGTDKRQQINGILSYTQGRSIAELDRLSETYALNRKQRTAIYPLIVAHDPQAHPAMLVGGEPLPYIPAGRTLDESIYAELTPAQRDLLTEKTLEHDAWWTEVASQLQDDLNNSLSNGEAFAPPTGTDSPAAPGISPSSGPALGDGQASEHSGGNLFDLLNGN